MNKREIIEILKMPNEQYMREVAEKAQSLYREQGGELLVSSMIGFTNVCKNNCLYCGMRASKKIERYRLTPDEVVSAAETVRKNGFMRIFLIAGEDPKYGFENMLEIVSRLKADGMTVAAALGELKREEYFELAAAGLDEYVLKFEMSDPETFNRLNPSTTFEKRMKCIDWVKLSGMKLASGNIVDYPGHTLEQMAEDILLMKKLEISWAPIVPYMPALGTPLAAEGGRGDIFLNLKTISVLRLLMPQIDITAQQPGKNLQNGFADHDGNLLALKAGANMLFADILPDAMVQNFSVIDHRASLRLESIAALASETGMRVKLA